MIDTGAILAAVGPAKGKFEAACFELTMAQKCLRFVDLQLLQKPHIKMDSFSTPTTESKM